MIVLVGENVKAWSTFGASPLGAAALAISGTLGAGAADAAISRTTLPVGGASPAPGNRTLLAVSAGNRNGSFELGSRGSYETAGAAGAPGAPGRSVGGAGGLAIAAPGNPTLLAVSAGNRNGSFESGLRGSYEIAGAGGTAEAARDTGTGGTASVSQAEVMLGHMATQIAAQSAGVDLPPRERSIFPAAGEDEWVVVTARDDGDRAALRAVTGDVPLAEWTRARDAAEAATALQAAGVPAGHMLRVVDLPDAPQFQALGTFRTVRHPLIDVPFAVEGAPARSRLPQPGQHSAPRIGEDSDGVLADWLGLSRTEIEDLLSRRVIETPVREAA